MNRRKVCCKYLSVFFILMCLMLGPAKGHCAKQSVLGMSYVDKEPWKIAWTYDDKTGWKVTTSFEDAHVTYFFKHGPSSEKGLNLSAKNPPYKIEFRDFITGQTITIKKEIAYEQWDDGAKTYGGKIEGNFVINGEKFKTIIVSLVQEVNGAKDYANYSLWKG